MTEQIKALREQSGAGMMECKKALVEAAGDMDQAMELLRKKGMALAAQKATRIAAEGLLGFAARADEAALLVEVNCETDFVAKNPEFIAFTDTLAAFALQNNLADVDALLQAPWSDGGTIADKVQQLTAKIGEKISLRRLTRLAKQDPSDAVVAYLHPGNRIGVIVRATNGKDTEKSLLRDVAMHIAAMAPEYLSAADIPAARVAKEREIAAAQLAEELSKKPAEIQDKILMGKITKWKKESALSDQLFVKDPEGKKTVAEWMQAHFPHLKLAQFVRYQVGEGIQKKSENFAEEVARQVAGR